MIISLLAIGLAFGNKISKGDDENGYHFQEDIIRQISASEYLGWAVK